MIFTLFHIQRIIGNFSSCAVLKLCFRCVFQETLLNQILRVGSDGLMFLNGYDGNGNLHTIVGWYSKLAPKITSLPDASVQGSITL